MIAAAPYAGREPTPDERFGINFAATNFPNPLAPPVTSPKNDQTIVAVTNREAFVIWQIIDGRPPSGPFVDKTLGAPTTSRFYHTLQKILAAAQG